MGFLSICLLIFLVSQTKRRYALSKWMSRIPVLWRVHHVSMLKLLLEPNLVQVAPPSGDFLRLKIVLFEVTTIDLKNFHYAKFSHLD